jgi:hypothetical protein
MGSAGSTGSMKRGDRLLHSSQASPASHSSYLLFFFALFLSACAAPSQVRFETDGLHYRSGGLAVAFRDPARFAFVPGPWRLDNWVLGYGNTISPRSGPRFEGDLLIDLDGDGRAETCKSFFADIELRNVETEGSIWVFMRELPGFRKQVSLDVLLEEYADGLTYQERERTGSINFWTVTTATTRSYAARIVSREHVKLGPYDAVLATIETANLEQLKLDPRSRDGYLRLLIARIPAFWTGDYTCSAFFPHSGVGILRVGYFEGPAYFEKGLPAFDAFLTQFRANGKPIEIVRPAAAHTSPTAPTADPVPAPEFQEAAEPETVSAP